MNEEQPEQIWEQGQDVIIFTPYGSYGRDDHNVSVHPIESVAPKSFKVSHYRFFKDKLGVRTQGGSFWLVCRMDDERAPYLLAERDVRRQAHKLAAVQRLWDRDSTVENAADLQVELHAWVEAEQARAAAYEALRLLREDAGHLSRLGHR